MTLFDVYPLFNITPAKAEGSWLWDDTGRKYLDLYGGHAVISVGHTHPHYVARMEAQLRQIAFYSNSVQIPQQKALAEKLGKLSGCEDYALFLCNSGAEANENALKLASFHNQRTRIIAFEKGFHGRTSLAVAATQDPKIQAAVNRTHEIVYVPLNDAEAFKAAMDERVCAVIVEGIQGIGGIYVPDDDFLRLIRSECDRCGAVMILDEVQSGYARAGHFFAHQQSGVRPDVITTAKGMGNGFPVAGVLISPMFEARHGMLGTTFGGNYLACAAALAVLEIIEDEDLVNHAKNMGDYLLEALRGMKGIADVRGRGLMIGIELPGPATEARNRLLHEHSIFTGSASNKNVIRLLPALNIGKAEIDVFLSAFERVL